MYALCNTNHHPISEHPLAQKPVVLHNSAPPDLLYLLADEKKKNTSTSKLFSTKTSSKSDPFSLSATSNKTIWSTNVVPAAFTWDHIHPIFSEGGTKSALYYIQQSRLISAFRCCPSL